MADAKPTLDVRWALTPADPNDVLNPSAQRAGGWAEGSPLPYNNLNYLLQAAGEFSYFTAQALGPTNDILTLTANNGYVQLISDPASIGAGDRHEYRHIGTATNVPSRWASDQINARAAFLLGEPEDINFSRDNVVDDVGQLVKMGAVVRVTVDDTAGELVVELISGVNCSAADVNLGLGTIDLFWDQEITASRVHVGKTPVRNGSGTRQGPGEQQLSFESVPFASGVRLHATFFDGTNFQNLVALWIDPTRDEFTVDLLVTVY